MTEGTYRMHNRAGHCLGQMTVVGAHDDGGEENVEQLTWQLILYNKHSHEHRPIGRMLDLETF